MELFKADRYLELAQFDRAMAHYLVLLKNAPASPVINNRIGFVFLKQENYSNAALRFQKALRADPTNSVYWNNLGVCRFRLKELSRAEEAWSRSLRYKPKNSRVLYNLAVVSFYQRKYRKSVDRLLEAYGCDRKYVENRFNRKKLMDEVGEMRRLYPDDRELADIERRLQERAKADDRVRRN